MKKALIIVATLLISQFANAEGYYVGAGLTSFSTNFKTDGFDKDTKKTLVNLIFGYQVNENFAVEMRLSPQENEKKAVSSTPPSIINGVEQTFDIKSQNPFSFFGKFTFPLKEGFSVYAVLGLATQSMSVTGNNNFLELESEESSIAYGVGAEYKFSDNLAGTFEITQYGDGEVSDSNNTTLDIDYKQKLAPSLGIKYNF